jgi:hypothetical protein
VDAIPLTEQEEAEYQRQLLELQNPHYHERIKCDNVLIPREIRIIKHKRRMKLNRLYCENHDVLVDGSGWAIGHYGGTDSLLLSDKPGDSSPQ